MKAFEYAAPRTESEVVQLLSAQPEAEILAGGTDLVGLMKKMIVTPKRVVNIMEVDSLKSIEVASDGSVEIGAAATLDDVFESPLLTPYQAVRQVIAGINSLQLQAQGTIGGELCQRPRCWYYRNGQGLLNGSAVEAGDNQFHAIFDNRGPAKFVSASRLAPALAALGARLLVLGAEDKQREIGVAELFQTPRREGQRVTTLESTELITKIVLPPLEGRLNGAYEVRHGCGPEYPLAAAACSFTHAGGVVQDVRIVLGHVAPTPRSAPEAERVLRGSIVDPQAAERAAEAAVADATPLSNNAHKVQLAKAAVKRAILSAAGLETGGF